MEHDVEGKKVPEASIQALAKGIANWVGGCCGMSAFGGTQNPTTNNAPPHIASYRGMNEIRSVESALALRVAAYRGNGYRSGYVVASTDTNRNGSSSFWGFSPEQIEGQHRCMIEAGWTLLAEFSNPAHGSGANIRLYGAPTIAIEKPKGEVIAKNEGIAGQAAGPWAGNVPIRLEGKA